MVLQAGEFKDLDLYVGDQIFIAGNNDTAHSLDDVKVFADPIALQEYLIKIDVSELKNMIVAFGSLTYAEILPSTLRNKNAYIIAIDRIEDYGVIIEMASGEVDDLAAEILDIMKPKPTSTIVPDINEIFVLYGQQLDVSDGIDPAMIDEEITHECNKILIELDSLGEIAKNQQGD